MSGSAFSAQEHIEALRFDINEFREELGPVAILMLDRLDSIEASIREEKS